MTRFCRKDRSWNVLAPAFIFAFCAVISLSGLVFAADVDVGSEFVRAETAARQGHFAAAAAAAGRAANEWASTGETSQAAEARLLQASALDALGRYSDAGAVLESLGESIPTVGDTRLRARFLGVLGSHLLAQGEIEEATRTLERAVAAAGPADGVTQDAVLEATIVHNLAGAVARSDDFERARRLARRAAKQALTSGEKGLAFFALAHAARAAADLGDFSGAQSIVKEAHALGADVPPDHQKAFALLHLARTLGAIQAAPDAGLMADPSIQENDLLMKAAEVAQAIGDTRALAHAYADRGRLYARSERFEEALVLIERGLAVADVGVNGGERAEWEAEAGRVLARLGQRDAAIESYRAAIDGLDRDRHAIAVGYARPGDSFRDRVSHVYLKAVDLILSRAAETTDSELRAADLRLAIDTVERLQTAELRDYYRDECVDAALARRIDLGEISKRAAVLYPILLPDRIEMVVSMGDRVWQYTTEVPEEEVRRVVGSMRRFLARRATRQYKRPARQLHEWLIAPVQEKLESLDIETLVFVPGEAFRTIPLAALHDGEGFLIERYAVASTPALRLTDRSGAPSGPIRVLRAGLSEGLRGFAPLPAVPGELRSIAELFEGETLLDADFVKSAIEGRLRDGPYDALHLASHASFSDDPAQSFVLTHDGRLTMDEIAESVGRLERRGRPLELLTLSACETAEGNAEAALGLSGVAVKAGASSALGTLWQVNDAAAARLVGTFYSTLRGQNVTKAEALRRAQLDLLESPTLRHPVDWAPFLLIGHWL